MTESSNFNMNNFLANQEYVQYNKKKYTAAENAKAAMEQADIDRAKEAIANNTFGSLTLGEKLAELGVGKRVVKQLADTAAGVVEGVISPFEQWLKESEQVIDQKFYHSEMQAMGKQIFFSNMAMSKEAAANPVGQRFLYDM